MMLQKIPCFLVNIRGLLTRSGSNHEESTSTTYPPKGLQSDILTKPYHYIPLIKLHFMVQSGNVIEMTLFRLTTSFLGKVRVYLVYFRTCICSIGRVNVVNEKKDLFMALNCQQQKLVRLKGHATHGTDIQIVLHIAQ